MEKELWTISPVFYLPVNSKTAPVFGFSAQQVQTGTWQLFPDAVFKAITLEIHNLVYTGEPTGRSFI